MFRCFRSVKLVLLGAAIFQFGTPVAQAATFLSACSAAEFMGAMVGAELFAPFNQKDSKCETTEFRKNLALQALAESSDLTIYVDIEHTQCFRMGALGAVLSAHNLEKADCHPSDSSAQNASAALETKCRNKANAAIEAECKLGDQAFLSAFVAEALVSTAPHICFAFAKSVLNEKTIKHSTSSLCQEANPL
jgi:hypothetical protein